MDKKFSENDINDILKYSKVQNRGYLHDVLSIKKITSFDALYIMTKLNLTSEKIKIIKLALKKYDTLALKCNESYNDFLFRVVRNIEKLENRNSKILDKISENKNKEENLSGFADYISGKSTFFEENNKPGYKFSTIFN